MKFSSGYPKSGRSLWKSPLHPLPYAVWATDMVNDLKHQQWIETALDHYDRTLSADPSLSDAWHARGHLLAQMHRYEEAIASYDRALELTDDDDIQKARNWVICLMQYHTQPTLTPDLAIAFVQQAISVLSEGSCRVEAEVIEALQKLGIGANHAQDLVIFIPLAFGRVFLQRTDVAFSPHLIWINPYTQEETSIRLDEQPFYQVAHALAQEWMATNTCMNILLPIASLSSEVEAVTQALNQGLALRGSQFSAPRAFRYLPR